MSVMEEIAKLLREGKSPREIVEMGYSESTVYTVKKRLEKQAKKQSLVEVAAQLMHRRKGALEIILADLLMQAIRTADPIEKILKICEAVFILDPSEREAVFSKEEIEELNRIYVIAIGLHNVAKFKDGEVSVSLPISFNEAKMYLSFLEELNMPEDYISVTGYPAYVEEIERRAENVKKKFGKEAGTLVYFHHSLSYESYYAVRNFFARYALPKVARALKAVAEIVQPSTLERVLSIFGGVRSGSVLDKRK